MRVRVPFGRQQLVGVVHSHAATSELPSEKLKSVLEVIDAEPVIDAQVLELLEWAAQYYHHPLGEVIAAALPRLAREGAPSRALTERWFATEAGIAALGKTLKRAPRQRELLEPLRDGEGVTSDALGGRIRGLAHARCARSWRAASPHPPKMPDDSPAETAGASWCAARVRRLSDEQAAAVEAIDAAHARFAPFLLYGITGSGKTEVYLHAVERTLRRSQRALVLVPEIGLTPQLVGRFRERFAVPVGGAAFGAHRYRATRRLAAVRVGRGAHRARHALGGVRAGRGSRAS